MSRFYFDCEFHEYKKKPLFGKPINTIELISIGIVSGGNIGNSKNSNCGLDYCKQEEDFDCNSCCFDNYKEDREYYAICKDFDLKAAWDNEWLRENVLKDIWKELMFVEHSDYFKTTGVKCLDGVEMIFKVFKQLINKYGKTREQIAKEIKEFVLPETSMTKQYSGRIDKLNGYWVKDVDQNPEFYSYYSSYDWVVFCWLFGRMIDLPDGFPMFCIDLKQEMERLNKTVSPTFRIQDRPNYPKQSNEHNALADSIFNKKLYHFLQSL